MSSLFSSVAARTMLQTLIVANQRLDTAQNRISTGLQVATPQDNAAYWSIATTMRSDVSALSTVSNALGLGSATVDVAAAALSTSIELVSEIKQRLIAAREPGAAKTKIQTEIAELQRQLDGVASAAVFGGENWLMVNSGVTGYNPTKQIVATFSRSAGVVTIGTIDVNIDTLKLYDTDATAIGILDGSRNAAGVLSTTGTLASLSSLSVANLTDSPADLLTLDAYLNGADAALAEMTTASTTLGAIQSRLSLQQTFVSSLVDAVDQGIGQLIDADMSEESTRVQALQVQAQLGIQVLSIANQTNQNILTLFQ